MPAFGADDLRALADYLDAASGLVTGFGGEGLPIRLAGVVVSGVRYPLHLNTDTERYVVEFTPPLSLRVM